MKLKNLGAKIKAFIFDLDGTLVDSFDAYQKSINKAFKILGLPLVTKKEVLEVMCKGKSPWEALIPKNISQRDKVIKECMLLTRKFFASTYLKEAKLIDGVYEVFRELTNKGVLIGIATAIQDKKALRILEKYGVDKFVSAVVRRSEVLRDKPAPDLILKCAKKLGVSPKNCVFVGDSPLDVKAGNAAGAVTIAVLTGVGDYISLIKEKPLKIVSGLGELLKFIRQIFEESQPNQKP